jgi:TM2 domain-containing membrane protein YozV
MLDPRISLKNRWLAGILAFLFPGAGHLYQGRFFKGIVCSICVLSTFFYGMALGDWSVVYWKRDPLNFLNPYYAQVFVGLPAFPSLIQSRRYQSRDNVDDFGISAPIAARFDGNLRVTDHSTGLTDGKVEGQLSIRPDEAAGEPRGARGELKGRLTPSDGPPREVTLGLEDVPRLGKPVTADPDRVLEIDVVDPGTNRKIGRLRGSIPRSFLDRFEAPPDEDYFLDLHRDLGKFFELAMTFTMIAGLLNILVILDAVEGPAYGFGDTSQEPKPADPTGSPGASGPPATSGTSGPGRSGGK